MKVKIALFMMLAIVVSACTDLAGEPEIVGQLPQQQAPVSVADVNPPDIAPDMALGAQVYAENCTRCHGLLGAGDGEFVLSGQIADIPDFTETSQHDGRTPTQYYTQVTNGNLEKLMPPFAGSLSDEERWSVANYIMTLAGDAVELPETGVTTNSEAAPVAPVHSTTTEVPDSGTINGAILQATTGAAIPDSGTVTLSIVQMTGEQTTIETELFSDGTYQFTDIPIIHDAGYFVSMDYGNGTYNSEFASLTAASPEINLNITIYETTDDDSVIQLEVVLAQVDLIDENTLQVWQLISVVNNSDRVYIYQDDRGESVSIEVPAPAGVQLSPDIDLSRFVFNDNSVYDTRPVIPGTDHSFHLMYTMSFGDKTVFRQTLPYDFSGPYEAYVDSDLLKISSVGWEILENPQTLEGVTYQGIVRNGDLNANQNIEFTIERKTNLLNRQTLGYAVITVGLLLIIVAGVFYWHSPDDVAPEETTELLMQSIAALDDSFARGEITRDNYDRQRKALKDRLAKMMQSE